MKSEADQQYETQLIHQYQDSFKIFESHLESETKYDLLQILKSFFLKVPFSSTITIQYE
ncbi:hypothetical protein LDL59_04190 [Kaistella anthropi]|nr:hypothetical protein [Kaistella anthropi]